MATKFLRKIIMEELQKVLEEQEIPGTEPGQTKSPYVKNKDRELDLGDTTFTVKKKAFDKRVYDLQQDLNATGKYNLTTDGILGSETMKAVRKEVGWMGTPQDMLANVSRVRGQLKGAIAANANKKLDSVSETYDKENKPHLDFGQPKGPEGIVLQPDPNKPISDKTLQNKPSVAPPEPSDSDEYSRGRTQGQKDLEKKMSEPATRIKVPKKSFGIEKEAIAREINKLLRSIQTLYKQPTTCYTYPTLHNRGLMDISQKILSDITHHMKYARFIRDDFRREQYEDTVRRNMNMHIAKHPHLEQEIRDAYNFVFERKVLPSMRSMQFGGRAIDVNPTRIFNCSFVAVDDPRAFNEIMFLLLGGTGVGYSVQKHHVEKLPELRKPNSKRTRRFLVGDSIEGWADSIKALMRSYFEGGSKVIFDFSDIRPKGARLVTAGGKAPGPQPLKECLIKVEGILESKEDGDKLQPIEVHDIVCHIADAVLAGGIRRSALISLFSADDDDMIASKSGHWWETNAQRGRANNSAVILRHRVTKEYFMDLWERIKSSGAGEPGIFFTNDKEWGTNPCAEIALRSNQFCNLCEVNVSDLESQEDYEARVKAAAFVGTLQASYTDFHYLRDVWRRTTEREALLGIGMTGIASNKVQKLDMEKAAKVAVEENKRVANLIGVNPAARVTTVKPSGTTSLILGTSSGVHAWHNDYYIRRIRVGKNEAIYKYLVQNHPELVEDEYFRPHDTAVISVPQRAPEGATMRTETAIEMLERVKDIHSRWVKPGHIKGQNTHNVSATVSVRNEEWAEVGEWMWENRDSYTGLSVLPYDGGSYKQAPFEDCDKETFDRLFESLKNVDLSQIFETDDETNLQAELACAGGACEIK